VCLADVDTALARLRAEAAAEGPSMRTSVMTHIAWVPHGWREPARAALEGMAERHPSRTLLLVPRPDEPDGLDAQISLRCFSLGDRSICGEVIELDLRGGRSKAPASIVLPLLISDLPVFCRWRGEPAWDATSFEQLIGIADRLIVDSTEWPDLPTPYARLEELFPRVAVSDIAWERTEPWRRALAGLWPGIAELDTLTVTGPHAEGLLLAGWLSGRLGRDVALDHSDAEELEAVEADGTAVEPAFLDVLSPSDLLSDQLEVFGRDRTYEEAVRSFSKVRT
jgi:glucose-6-phosphate dehydrogenase assembly protein OpcA